MNIDIWLQIQNIFESITSFEMKQRHYALLLFTLLVIALIKGRKYQPSGVRSDSRASSDEDWHNIHPLTGNQMEYHSDVDRPRPNPATGYSVYGCVDTAGNPNGFSSSSNYEHRFSHDPYYHYGFSYSSSINDDYRSSHDPHHH